MLEKEIKILQNKINNLVSKGADYGQIYTVSVELDQLISDYYKVSVQANSK